ncbi:MAG TPA: serine hydrolase, partial [Steroidobacteraceae bacterium]|nr:serine hydrolase [Steroidobacteraceae bacterium]
MRLVFLILVAALASTHAANAQSNPKQQVLWDHLRLAVGEEERQLDGVLGVAILDLNSGQTLLVHPDEIFPQASSIKIAVLAELYRQAQQAARGVGGNATL